MPRWGVVFAVALLARLLFLFTADQPLLYTHQYHYFNSALRIAEHPHPLWYVWTSEEWRTWNHHWTIAPLYHLFAAAVFLVCGPHLLPLRLVQCVLDALAAVGVGALGRQAAGPRGWWAGLAYALYWPAVEMPTWTLTENLHTVLLVGAVALLAREPARHPRAQLVAAGALLGLGSLARSVTTGFLGLVVIWLALRAFRASGAGTPLVMRLRRALPAAALVASGGAAVILPWTARNVFVIGDRVLIETTAFENIWFANSFVDPARFLRQQHVVHGQPSPAAKRAAALHFAWRGLTRSPELFLDKVRLNFWHFLRPEGLQNALRVERSQEGWRHAGALLLDDPLLLASLPLLLVFLAAGRASPARTLMALWLGYYVLMVVVVFHNEIRYRSAFVPFAFAGAAGGLAVLASGERRRAARIALAGGGLLVAAILWPYVRPGWRVLRSWPASRAAERATPTAPAEAWSHAEEAARRAPGSARPWMDLGRAFAHGGQAEQALAAYDRATPLATAGNWRAVLARPRLLAGLDRTDDAQRALRRAHRLAWDADPWLAQEVAWRELPAPLTDVVVVGGNDYGAVRGFVYPRGDDVGAHRLEWNKYDRPGEPAPPPGLHRWSRGRAWMRLRPTTPAGAYTVRLAMGSPFPSPLDAPEVTLRATGAAPMRIRLGREIATYELRAAPPPGAPIVVQLDAPTWNRLGEPAEQGVRVDKIEAAPASAGR